MDVQAGEGEPSLGEEGEQGRVDLVRMGPRDVVRSAVQGDHPDVLDHVCSAEGNGLVDDGAQLPRKIITMSVMRSGPGENGLAAEGIAMRSVLTKDLLDSVATAT